MTPKAIRPTRSAIDVAESKRAGSSGWRSPAACRLKDRTYVGMKKRTCGTPTDMEVTEATIMRKRGSLTNFKSSELAMPSKNFLRGLLPFFSLEANSPSLPAVRLPSCQKKILLPGDPTILAAGSPRRREYSNEQFTSSFVVVSAALSTTRLGVGAITMPWNSKSMLTQREDPDG